MRTTFHVFPAGSEWEITRGTRDDVLMSFPTRNQAIAWGLERGRESGRGKLKVYNREHALVEEFTFGDQPALFQLD